MPPESVVLIPARYGSTRFPGKALHRIGGKPLVQHVWERCRQADAVDEVIVATDDQRIADVATAFGARVEMTSVAHPSGTDRIAEVAARLSMAQVIINVQGDEPLIDPALITLLVQRLKEDRSISMITAASAIDAAADIANPNIVKVVLNARFDALYFSRSAIPFVRDGRPAVPFFRHHGIYGYRRSFLLEFVRWEPGLLEKTEQLEQLRALENGASIRVVLTQSASIGIDTPEDAARCESLLSPV